MGSFLAAAVQLTSTPDPDANFVAAEEQIELAARRGAELVGLPENFAFMGEDSRRLELAPALAERCSRFLVTMARRYQVTLLGGGLSLIATRQLWAVAEAKRLHVGGLCNRSLTGFATTLPSLLEGLGPEPEAVNAAQQA